MAGRGPILGIDVGGTFTDAVVLDGSDGRLLAAFKLPSTPDDPGRAVVQAVDRAAEAFPIAGAIVCHGTTVGTNILIERRGAPTALVATRGFADVIELRRQARPRLYDLAVEISPPLIPPELRFEADERIGAGGEVVRALGELEPVLSALGAAGVGAVAVSFLNAYANDRHEIEAAEAIRAALPHVFVSRSSDVCPEFREYERTSTAAVNAYIGPAVGRYLEALDAALGERGVGRLMVVKSNGGLTSPRNAARYPVHLIESGPAAGLAAAAAYARAAGRPDLIAFDMGGTTAKAGVIRIGDRRRPNLIAFDMGGTTAKAGVIRNGEPQTGTEFYADRLAEGRDVGGYAIRSPILDLVEIGAGGGSLARIDEAGVLKVGPQSAGADPGPACYGRGGERPTVTDAHAVIGTLGAEAFAGTGVAFDRTRAEAAVRRHVAEPFGWPLARAAHAILDIAVANMAEMVRLATVQRGLDPRDHPVLASGGAGPLHATLVAEAVGAREVIVPPHPGMFSALGATLGSVRHELVRTILRPLDEVTAADIETAFEGLRQRAEALLAAEPKTVRAPGLARCAEARFVGQLFELRVPLEAGPVAPGFIETGFRQAYRREYGFDLPDAKVQLVDLRLVATLDLGSRAEALFGPEDAPAGPPGALSRLRLLARDGREEEVAFAEAAALAGTRLPGPAVIAHSGSTVWVQAGQVASVGRNGHILVRLPERAP